MKYPVSSTGTAVNRRPGKGDDIVGGACTQNIGGKTHGDMGIRKAVADLGSRAERIADPEPRTACRGIDGIGRKEQL